MPGRTPVMVRQKPNLVLVPRLVTPGAILWWHVWGVRGGGLGPMLRTRRAKASVAVFCGPRRLPGSIAVSLPHRLLLRRCNPTSTVVKAIRCIAVAAALVATAVKVYRTLRRHCAVKGTAAARLEPVLPLPRLNAMPMAAAAAITSVMAVKLPQTVFSGGFVFPGHRHRLPSALPVAEKRRSQRRRFLGMAVASSGLARWLRHLHAKMLRQQQGLHHHHHHHQVLLRPGHRWVAWRQLRAICWLPPELPSRGCNVQGLRSRQWPHHSRAPVQNNLDRILLGIHRQDYQCHHHQGRRCQTVVALWRQPSAAETPSRTMRGVVPLPARSSVAAAVVASARTHGKGHHPL